MCVIENKLKGFGRLKVVIQSCGNKIDLTAAEVVDMKLMSSDRLDDQTWKF